MLAGPLECMTFLYQSFIDLSAMKLPNKTEYKKIMIKLKDLLLENPDTIKIDGKNYDFKSDAASHTFLVYYDEVDNKEYWVDYVYPKYRRNGKAILCENKEVEKKNKTKQQKTEQERK